MMFSLISRSGIDSNFMIEALRDKVIAGGPLHLRRPSGLADFRMLLLSVFLLQQAVYGSASGAT